MVEISTDGDMEPTLSVHGKTATIAFCSPNRGNRLTPGNLITLRRHLSQINESKEIVVLRFVSNGKYFCSGYDIGSLGDPTAPSSIYFGQTIDLIEAARPITIAAIHGGVYGGGTDLCLACDFRIGSTAANMFMPAARLGLRFYGNGLKRYMTRLGFNSTKRLFLRAEKIAADEMKEIGFLDELVRPTELAIRMEEISEELTRMAPDALCGIKADINRTSVGALNEVENIRAVLESETSMELKEGINAWREKRLARF